MAAAFSVNVTARSQLKIAAAGFSTKNFTITKTTRELPVDYDSPPIVSNALNERKHAAMTKKKARKALLFALKPLTYS
jgi:hypothetical protein